MAVGLPTVISKVQRLSGRTSGLFVGRGSVQGLVHPDLIVVALKLFEFLFQVHLVPEEPFDPNTLAATRRKRNIPNSETFWLHSHRAPGRLCHHRNPRRFASSGA